MARSFDSFAEFYPYYLSEHRDPTCRVLHYVGTGLGGSLLVAAVWRGQPSLILGGLLVGYAFAWVGHFVFEKNRPATFQHPLYSFAGDWVMLKDFVTGRLASRDGYAATRDAD